MREIKMNNRAAVIFMAPQTDPLIQARFFRQALFLMQHQEQVASVGV